MPTDNDILNFIFELGQLRHIKNAGHRLIGVDQPYSVAEHNLRAAQIGFILAKMEKYKDPYEICTMVVFHDMEECRTGDVNKVMNRYITGDKLGAANDQTAKLDTIGKDIAHLWKQHEEHTTPAGIISKDADLLEQAVMAKELVEKGYAYAQDWIKNVGMKLQTPSAKKLWEALQKSDSNAWWQGLKKHTDIPKK
ncbi:MAG TPA: HD domain-containing protein [Candidatus Nanoarchaeia archaeon]|nr:HD domain-containing protein [Candidatus Nanoarchaeia archaeon]